MDLSLIDLLLIFFRIRMCHFDSVVSLGVESDNQAFHLVMKCFAPVFWCHFEHKIVFYYLCLTTREKKTADKRNIIAAEFAHTLGKEEHYTKLQETVERMSYSHEAISLGFLDDYVRELNEIHC